MKAKIIIASILGAAMTFSSAASAQEKVTVDGNIDLVNNYVWRGMDQMTRRTLHFTGDGVSAQNDGRYLGFPVRPVRLVEVSQSQQYRMAMGFIYPSAS